MKSLNAVVVYVLIVAASLTAAESKSDVQKIMKQGHLQTLAQFEGRIGPQVGEKLASFELPNQHGQTVFLSDLFKHGPVVVTFYRGGWCPYCNLALKTLQDNLGLIQELGATLVAISPETPDHTVTTAEKNAIGFPVLSDVGNGYAKQLGLVFVLPKSLQELYPQFGIDVPAHNGDASYTLPVPATYVVDPQGYIRYAFANVDYKQRASVDAIVEALKAIR